MSLQLWLPMTKDLTQQGLQTVSATNVGATLDNNGKLGKCYSFNGNGNYLLFNYGLPKTVNTWSYCCWAKLVNNSTTMCLYSQRTTTTDNQRTIFIVQGKVFYFDDGVRIQGSLNTSADLTQWNHYAFIRNGNSLKIYINGIETVSTTISSTPATVGSYTMIGASQNTNTTPSGNSLYGYLNDIRLYDHALSPKEIEILSRGLVCHYPLNGGGRGGDNIITGSWTEERTFTYPSSSYSDKFAPTTTIVPSAPHYVLSFWAKSTVAGDKIIAYWYSPNTTTRGESSQGVVSTSADGNITFTLSTDWEKYWCIWTQSSTTAVKHLICPRMFSTGGTGTVSIKNIKLEEGTIPTPWMPNSADTAYSAMGYNSTTEYDVSGYQNNGIKTDALTYSSDTPRYSISTIFDANTDNITPSSFYSLGQTIDEMSVSIWFKTNTLNSTQPNLWSLGENSFVRMRLASATSLWYYAKVGGMPGNASTYTTKSLTDNTWHHAVYTFKAGIVTVYLDGVQVGTTNHAGNGKYMTCSNISWHIGGYSSNAEKFIGSLSDFRIYATALSAAQVAELYNTAVSVANNGTLLGYELVEV